MRYRFGIDAGSKTIKVVSLDDDGRPVHTIYRRHRANIRQTMQEILHDLVWRYGDLEGSFAVTGSAGIEIAEALDLPFVQEVIATTEAVQEFIPEADAFIELGGEDAKIVYVTGGLEQRMNATCAGGTGGFIDTIAFMLGIRTKDMSNLSMGSNRLYPIASRCAVFAQTDVRPLLNSGAKKSDIAASTLEAVVKQTIGGLACGRPLRGTVVFLGGPLEHIPDLVYRFRRALGLTHKTGIKPGNAHLFTAMGAALIGGRGESESHALCFSELERRLLEAPEAERDMPALPPLFASYDDLAVFKERHEATKTPRKDLSRAEGALYVGIDAGSTTVKLAVVDDEKNLVYSDYRPTKGDTLKTATVLLEQLYRAMPREFSRKPLVHIAHATVTGYGEDLLKTAFNADSGIVETLAHMRASQHFYPEVDFILDIGGQDMKALWVKNGAIQNAVLNEACSSGCGSFIEGTAYSLQLNPYSFADLALKAAHPIDLGMKCTVFMTSRVRHAQKIGVPYGDIAAGLAYSVVENALFKIIGMNNLDDMGDIVVVQGGAFMSDAVLRAFELVSDKQVIRPDIAHLMGAFGAALTAHSRADGTESGLIVDERLKNLKPVKHLQRCIGCSNACPLTVLEFVEDDGPQGPKPLPRKSREEKDEGSEGSEERKRVPDEANRGINRGERDQPTRVFISGNRCSRAPLLLKRSHESPSSLFLTSEMNAHAHQEGADRAPNLFALEQKLLARYRHRREPVAVAASREDIYVGIPPVLNLYETLPFWHTLLAELGFSVIVSSSGTEDDEGPPGRRKDDAGMTNRKNSSYMRGLETVPSESVCYPAKSSHLHIAQLIEADVDAVLFPAYERGTRCPISSNYSFALKDSVPELSERTVALVAPTLQAINPAKLIGNGRDVASLLAALNEVVPASKAIGIEEFQGALAQALAQQEAFIETLETATKVALDWVAKGHHGIVLASRPYHVDKAISHGIDEMLREFGLAVFSPLGLRRIVKAASRKKRAEGDALPVSSGSDERFGDEGSGAVRDAERARAEAGRTGDRAGSDNVYKNEVAAPVHSLRDGVTNTWKPAKTMTRLADFIAGNNALDLVCLYSFGCGYDSLSLAHAQETVERAGKIFTAFKIDEITDLVHIRIRLRTLVETLSERDASLFKEKTASPSCMNERATTDIGDHAVRLQPLVQEDIDTAKAFVNHDICYVAAAIAGQVIRLLKEDPTITALVLPRVCQTCLLDDIDDLVQQALGCCPKIIWEYAWHPAEELHGSFRAQKAPENDGENRQSTEEGMVGHGGSRHDTEEGRENEKYSEDVKGPQGERQREDSDADGGDSSRPFLQEGKTARPKIGLLGTALFCFDEFANHGIARLIEEQGCIPVFPDPKNLFVENVRYTKQIEAYRDEGVRHIIYLQAFGCLKGHVEARGALRGLKKLYPEMHITVVDYDHDTSALNQENRVRLALSAARKEYLPY